jgi:hypothetical protein
VDEERIMARRKGGEKVVAMAKAGAAKRVVRKRFTPSNVTGLPKSELFTAKELSKRRTILGNTGGASKRWERSWEKTRAKNRKMTSGLRKQYEKSVAKNKRRTPSR